MQSDSLVHYQVSGYSNMIGNVLFRTDGRELRAETAQYFENIARLEADGNVRLVELERGTVITGEDLLYLRAGPQRPQEQLTVTGGRPRAVLYPRRDTLRVPDAPSPDSVSPYQIDADRIYLVGDQYLQAQGTVEVQRDSLQAFSDSLNYDQVGGALDLSGRPARVIQGELDLQGRRLRILLPGDVIEEVVAREDAILDTDSLDVEAPFIRIFMLDGALDRLVAAAPKQAAPDAATAGPVPSQGVPPVPGGIPRGLPTPTAGAAAPEGEEEPAPRARAVGTSITMEADSIDVLAPDQRLQHMTAVGRARAVSTARDTLNTADTPEELRNDWIEGDTVRAAFIPIPSLTDPTASEYALESLEARINARSLYRLDPDSTQRADTTAFKGRLPINYTEAAAITLFFEDGRITDMEWVGLRRGIQLQPTRRPDDAARRAGGGEDNER
jgi:lipopolysaccharide export system protein LptA